MSTVTQTAGTLSSSLPDVVNIAVRTIVERAKVDKAGAYWHLGAAYRSANSGTLAVSLGYGTAGILLVLLEHHRRTRDNQTAELLHSGLEWVRRRTRGAPFVHGFYGGTSGLWYLYREIERDFPEWVGGWREEAIAALRTAGAEGSASLSLGCAGTVVGILASLGGEAAEQRDLIRPLIARTLSFAGVGETGLFWDCNVTSMCPPLGLLYGNAGIEYCLAYSAGILNQRCTTALIGSLARAHSAFDEKERNWPDYDAVSSLRRADEKSLERFLDQIERGQSAEDVPEFSLGWGSGAAGVLLSRVVVASAFPGGALGTRAQTDVARALECIRCRSQSSADSMDSSVQNGLAGLALALRAVTRREAKLVDSVRECAAAIESLLAARRPEATHDDLSLMTGVAGHAYALLVDEHGASCVDPLGDTCPATPSVHASEVPASTLLRLRMPSCSEIPAFGTAWSDRALTLPAIREQVNEAIVAEPSAIINRCRALELEFQQLLATTNFRRRFWAELAARRRFARQFGQAMDDAVLFGAFRLDDSVSLVELDFDPRARSALPAGEKILGLRQRGSKGVIDVRISPLQAALLEGFKHGEVSIRVIREVIERVQTPNVTRRQLAALSLKFIRGFISAGQVVPVAMNPVSAWMNRKKYRETRRHLFPAS